MLSFRAVAGRPSLLAVVLATLFIILQFGVALGQEASTASNVGNLSVFEIEEQLQECDLVERLNKQKAASSQNESGIVSTVFSMLFPGSPAVNSILATLYISGPPNFILGFCPPNIDPSSLTVMVAFAVGGLLGDTLFHLLPEIFVGEDSPEHVRFVMVEPNKNLLLGVAIMVGFVTFVAMDKTLRITTGGEGDEHGHNHNDDQLKSQANDENATASGASKLEANGTIKQRNAVSQPNEAVVEASPQVVQGPSSSLSGYLNMIADFTHNITDGIALASSFYTSPTIGATTTAAVFFHEIPHEIGDFALLIQSGFSKRRAMGAQFVTALGAFLGCIIGIAVQEFGGSGDTKPAKGAGLLGTSLTWGDMLLPWTAGTFLYVGTVSVIPELLETGPNKAAETRKTLYQFVAMTAGASIMLAISWT